MAYINGNEIYFGIVGNAGAENQDKFAMSDVYPISNGGVSDDIIATAEQEE